MGRSNCATLDALIAEATVDCYNDSECVTGFYTMLDDNLTVPFQTVVLDVDVTVAGIYGRKVNLAKPSTSPRSQGQKNHVLRGRVWARTRT